MNENQPTVTDNAVQNRFELVENGHTAYADYLISGQTLTLRLVFAPEELRGSGAAGRLMSGITDIARARGLKIIPICGYAAAWIRKHPGTHDLLA